MNKDEFNELLQSIREETSPEKLLEIWKSLPPLQPDCASTRESFITNMVANIFVRNNNTPSEVLKDIISNNIGINSEHPNIKNIPIETLEELCPINNINYWLVLTHKDITPEKLDEAATDEAHRRWILCIIKNDKVWPETLDKIARMKPFYNFEHFVQNSKLWPETLDYIAKTHLAYGEEVARHPNTSEKTLLYLYNKNSPGIKMALLANPNTPELIRKDIEDMFMSENKENFLQHISISESTDKLFKRYASLVNLYTEEDGEGYVMTEYNLVAALIRMNKELLESTINLYNNAALFNHPGDSCWQHLSDDVLDKMNTASTLIYNKSIDEYLNSRN